jgi:hypothetical protein
VGLCSRAVARGVKRNACLQGVARPHCVVARTPIPGFAPLHPGYLVPGKADIPRAERRVLHPQRCGRTHEGRIRHRRSRICCTLPGRKMKTGRASPHGHVLFIECCDDGGVASPPMSLLRVLCVLRGSAQRNLALLEAHTRWASCVSPTYGTGPWKSLPTNRATSSVGQGGAADSLTGAHARPSRAQSLSSSVPSVAGCFGADQRHSFQPAYFFSSKRAIVARWTSSGPSARRSRRATA